VADKKFHLMIHHIPINNLFLMQPPCIPLHQITGDFLKDKSNVLVA